MFPTDIRPGEMARPFPAAAKAILAVAFLAMAGAFIMLLTAP
jgi:hypothetical protein